MITKDYPFICYYSMRKTAMISGTEFNNQGDKHFMKNNIENKNVQITIKGTQHDISDSSMETTYLGSYRQLAGKHVISYNEYFEEDGAPPSTNANLIKIDNGTIHITKKGTVNTQMHFESGKKHHGIYQTPFGSFDMVIHTEKLAILETEQGLVADILYTLSLNHCPVSKCTIQIKVTERNSSL